MCLSKPKTPATPAPVVIPPEQEKKLELNPKATKEKKKKTNRVGTRSLQIPMGGVGDRASGLNIPR